MCLLCSNALLYMLPRGHTHLPSTKLTARFALFVFACTHLVTTLAHSWAHPCVLADPRLSRKIRDACAYARADGHKYLWIDSCCIDKSSSGELSEAINAMYSWYEIAVICYAYLSDVPASGRSFKRSFHYSRWHTCSGPCVMPCGDTSSIATTLGVLSRAIRP